MTGIGGELIEALSAFAALERTIVDLDNRADASLAVEFVRMRRDLVLEFTKLGRALEQDHWLTSQPELFQQTMRLFSAFRTQNTINQADWPVVRVKDHLPDYRVAAGPVAERSRAFWQWIEQELGFKR